MALSRSAVFLFLASCALALAADSSRPAFTFRGVEYFHRFTSETQHEFTPASQEDLEHWTDMITINAYPGVNDGQKLAGAANAVLTNYKRARGKILKTSSVPASDDKPAEHFIAALFTRPGFQEAVFARFELVDETGHSFVYSHRFYGENADEEMNEWLRANGEKTENDLLDWKLPAPPKK